MPELQPELFGSDEPLWYRVGRWGDAGYAVPNLGGKLYTSNLVISELFNVVGLNLFAILHKPDARQNRPMNIGILRAVHNLVLRCRSKLAIRALPANRERFDPEHTTPTRKPFVVYPVPYFGSAIRQPLVAEWCNYSLNLLGEMAQHTDNEYSYEITEDYARMMGKYLQRIYYQLATECLREKPEAAREPSYVIPESLFAAYDPMASPAYTSVELIDERPDYSWVPTENDLREIRGIPADRLAGLVRYPSGLPVPVGGVPDPYNPKPTSPAGTTGAPVDKGAAPAVPGGLIPPFVQ